MDNSQHVLFTQSIVCLSEWLGLIKVAFDYAKTDTFSKVGRTDASSGMQ